MPDMNKLKAALPEGVSVVMIVGALEDSGYSIDPPIMTDEGEPMASSESEMSEDPMAEDAMGGSAGDMFGGMEADESMDPVGPMPMGRLSRQEQAGKLDEMNLDEYEE